MIFDFEYDNTIAQVLLVTGGNGDSGYKLASTEVSLSSSKQKVSVISLLQSQINVLGVVQIRINGYSLLYFLKLHKSV